MDFPDVETLSLEDGCVRVTVGDQMGTVSSFHLVEPKANQLREAWLRARYIEASFLQVWNVRCYVHVIERADLFDLIFGHI